MTTTTTGKTRYNAYPLEYIYQIWNFTTDLTLLIGECQQGLGDVIRVLELEQLGTYCHSQALKAKKLLTEMNDVIRFVDFL